MAATQDFLEFDQIKDGIMILKNKGLRAILMVSSLNFVLKSNEEQNAILYQFQNFLNSLDFSCQILALSRQLNITGYLEKLEEIEKKEKNELIQVQISEYRKFIKEIMQGGSVMQKSFYVVIPFSIGETQGAGRKSQIPKFELTEDLFQRAKAQLLQRLEYVISGLGACSLKATPLNTMEISELLWSIYHPAEAERGYYPELPEELAK